MVSDFLLHLALLLLFDDCLFYVLHRGAHASRALYHWYHAVHHKCRVPSGMFAMLAHPAEFAPGMVALKVFNPHPYTAFVWMVLRVWEGVDTHCGYDSPCSVFNLFRVLILFFEGVIGGFFGGLFGLIFESKVAFDQVIFVCHVAPYPVSERVR